LADRQHNISPQAMKFFNPDSTWKKVAQKNLKVENK